MHALRANDRLAVSKLVTQLTRSGVRSPMAQCLLVRYVAQVRCREGGSVAGKVLVGWEVWEAARQAQSAVQRRRLHAVQGGCGCVAVSTSPAPQCSHTHCHCPLSTSPAPLRARSLLRASPARAPSSAPFTTSSSPACATRARWGVVPRSSDGCPAALAVCSSSYLCSSSARAAAASRAAARHACLRRSPALPAHPASPLLRCRSAPGGDL